MSSPEENTDQVIKALCEESNLLAFVEGQEEYEQSLKRLFNGSQSNKPKAFIKPENTDEICHVLQYASANQLQVSVLGGGHDPKGMLRNQHLTLLYYVVVDVDLYCVHTRPKHV